MKKRLRQQKFKVPNGWYREVTSHDNLFHPGEEVLRVSANCDEIAAFYEADCEAQAPLIQQGKKKGDHREWSPFRGIVVKI